MLMMFLIISEKVFSLNPITWTKKTIIDITRQKKIKLFYLIKDIIIIKLYVIKLKKYYFIAFFI